MKAAVLVFKDSISKAMPHSSVVVFTCRIFILITGNATRHCL